MVWKFLSDDPRVCDFFIQLGPYYMPQLDLIDLSLFAEKSGLSHLVPEIIEPQMV